ncbi:MAG TPA: GerMN domain-containing protein [Clostridium sp.]|jgi:germination protein M|nr:GerMN domain-containing protein [Clostridium sp.]
MRRFISIVIFMMLIFSIGCQMPVDNVATDKDEEFDYIRKEDEILDTYVSPYSEIEEIQDDYEEDDEDEKYEEPYNDEYVKITAYYRDGDNIVVPITRKIKRQEGIARAVIEGMIKNDENTNVLQPYKLFAPLPEGTVVLGMNIKEDTVIVDFNEKFLEYGDKTEEINIISSIVYSLTEFENINNVKILIEGREKDILKYGTNISGLLNRNNVLINSKRLNVEEKVEKIDVYLYKNEGGEINYLLPMSFEYIGIAKEEICNEIIRLLGKNYDDKKMFSSLPSGVNLIDSKLEENTLILNFSDKIKNYGGTSREEGIIEQILYSMKQIEGVEKVKIIIEGKEGKLPEGTDISRGIPILNKINEV